MSLYETWQQVAQAQQSREAYDAFWTAYFEAETKNYKKILEHHDTVFSGKLADVAKEFDMDPATFTGFLDGANTSFKNGELDLESLTEDSEIALDFDFDRLYINMHNAKADWLYNLPEWDAVRTAEQRRELTKQYRAEKVFVAPPTVGRNDPCPCGSGKKYKKCCGKND